MHPGTLLNFEHHHPHPGPVKNAAIRAELGLTDIRYYTLLLRAAHSPQGIAADPITARIVRERATRQAAHRTTRTAA